MTTTHTISFGDATLLTDLNQAADTDIDELGFGVIGFDAKGVVRCYNRFESTCAGLSPQRVIGNPLFTYVAPCMNNFMVAQRFEDAQASNAALDETVDYVLTLRMRPVKVRLRLLAAPGAVLRYVLVERKT